MEKLGAALLVLVKIVGTFSLGCPPQYKEYSGHCYRWHQTKLNFTESRRTCQNEGGDLVSINTQAEDRFLVQNKDYSPGHYYWMGMEYVAGRYRWLDGSPVTYAHWAPTNPDCMRLTEYRCSPMYSKTHPGLWKDLWSGYEESFICEFVPKNGFREAIHLECHHLGWYVTLNLNKLLRRPSDVTEIYMTQDTCTGTVEGDLLVFNQTYKQCDTRAQITDGEVTFNNYLVYATRDSNNITRTFRWGEDLHCSPDQASAWKSNITVQGSSSGNIPGSSPDISLYTDSTFTRSLQGTVTQGAHVYVEVLSYRVGIVMVVDSCDGGLNASSSHNQNPVPIIRHHCSLKPSTYMIDLMPQVTRFKFIWPDRPNNEQSSIYVTCNVIFCDQSDPSAECHQTCKGSSLVG